MIRWCKDLSFFCSWEINLSIHNRKTNRFDKHFPDETTIKLSTVINTFIMTCSRTFTQIEEHDISGLLFATLRITTRAPVALNFQATVRVSLAFLLEGGGPLLGIWVVPHFFEIKPLFCSFSPLDGT